MTGTPAPGAGASEVARLHPLLTFLRHQPYGGAGGRRLWEVRVLFTHESQLCALYIWCGHPDVRHTRSKFQCQSVACMISI